MQLNRNSTASLTSASTEILPANPKRKGYSITNTSAAAVVTISKSAAAAVSGQGVVLQPNATLFESNDQNFTVWQQQIQAITDGAAGSVGISEMFEV